jgi:hypothetical protein
MTNKPILACILRRSSSRSYTDKKFAVWSSPHTDIEWQRTLPPYDLSRPIKNYTFKGTRNSMMHPSMIGRRWNRERGALTDGRS